jgi:hypothetical protein
MSALQNTCIYIGRRFAGAFFMSVSKGGMVWHASDCAKAPLLNNTNIAVTNHAKDTSVHAPLIVIRPESHPEAFASNFKALVEAVLIFAVSAAVAVFWFASGPRSGLAHPVPRSNACYLPVTFSAALIILFHSPTHFPKMPAM